jgi:hypothetical protein
VPRIRPDPTPRITPRGIAGYVFSGSDADDGAPLTDYDIIGSAAQRTGIFALDAVDGFNLLCIPPLARDVDVGASTLLVSNRYCRERRALLFVDPPRAWDSAAKALAEMRHWPLPSTRPVCSSRASSATTSCAAASRRSRRRAPSPGALARIRALAGVDGAPAARRRSCGRASSSPAPWTTSSAAASRPPASTPCRPCDAPGATRRRSRRSRARGGAADWRSLAARRLALLVLNSIERGTRWVVFEPNEPQTWRRAEAQMRDFLATLEARGAFAEREAGDRWFAVCDERINRDRRREQGIVSLLFGIPGFGPGRFHAWLVTHRAGGQPRADREPEPCWSPGLGALAGARELDVPGRRDLLAETAPAGVSISIASPASTRSAAQAGSRTVSPSARTIRLIPFAPAAPPAMPKGRCAGDSPARRPSSARGTRCGARARRRRGAARAPEPRR